MLSSKNEILRNLDPSRPDTIRALLDFHRRTFGGYVMEEKTGEGGTGDKQGTDSDGKTGDTADKPQDGEGDLGEGGKRALSAEREARKSLEREIAALKASQIDPKKLAEALGIKTEDAKSSDDVTAALQKQVSDMQQENRLYRIAAKHQITDEGDLALLADITDESAMDKLAARLAGTATREGGGTDRDQKRSPRPDKSQGNSGDGTKRASSVKQVMEERRAAREAKK